MTRRSQRRSFNVFNYPDQWFLYIGGQDWPTGNDTMLWIIQLMFSVQFSRSLVSDSATP